MQSVQIMPKSSLITTSWRDGKAELCFLCPPKACPARFLRLSINLQCFQRALAPISQTTSRLENLSVASGSPGVSPHSSVIGTGAQAPAYQKPGYEPTPGAHPSLAVAPTLAPIYAIISTCSFLPWSAAPLRQRDCNSDSFRYACQSPAYNACPHVAYESPLPYMAGTSSMQNE